MDSSERLLDLLAYLLGARGPVAKDDIYSALPGAYRGSEEARERKLSRDKEQLRELGIPLVVQRSDGDEEERGLAIDRSVFYLPDIALTADERASLFAVGAAALAGDTPLKTELAHALAKLRAVHPDRGERAAPVVMASGPRRPEIEELLTRAVAERRRLRLVYPPERAAREVDPYAVSVRRNRFAFVGFCHLRQAIRTFQADRVASCEWASRGLGPEFEMPPDFDPLPHLPVHAWQLRAHPPVAVTLEFPEALRETGPRALGVEPGAAVPATNLDGLVAELLTFGEGVRIAGPPSARARMREILKTLRRRLGEAA